MSDQYKQYTWEELGALVLNNNKETAFLEEQGIEIDDGPLWEHVRYMASEKMMSGPIHGYLKAFGFIVDKDGVSFLIESRYDGGSSLQLIGLDIAKALSLMTSAEYEEEFDHEKAPFWMSDILEVWSDDAHDYAGPYVDAVISFIEKALGTDEKGRTFVEMSFESDEKG